MVRTAPVRKKAGQSPASSGNARGEAPQAPRELQSDPASFDALLRRTIGLSLGEHIEKTGSREELASVLRDLQPEARSKLRIVMTAGRDGLGLGSAHASLSAAPQDALGASQLESAGDKLGDYLARGYAIACATQFDLDAPLDRWSVSESGELEERVWLRFGKQLAISPPEEWECLGAVGASGEALAQLYLRLGKAVWWSFGAVLDRPSLETVRKGGGARSGRHSKLGPLRNVAARRCEPERRALRRALRAIRARIGKSLDA
jgi:hypothetical protein